MRCLAAGILLLACVSTAAADDDRLFLPNVSGAAESAEKEVSGAAEVAAVAALTRFDSWLTAHPGDADAAAERCRFLDRITASDVDWVVRFYDAAESCREDLQREFGSTLAAMAYAVESAWGEEASVAAERFFSSGGEGSRYELIVRKWLVQSLDGEEHARSRIQHAQVAMRLDPELDFSYELAQALKSSGDTAGAIDALRQRSGSDAKPWQLAIKAKLLFNLGAYEASLPLFEQAAAGDAYVDHMAWARSLAAVGRLADAREQLGHHVERSVAPDTGRRDALEDVVDFELAHGDAQSTDLAYQRFRDEGYMADPLARKRIAVSLTHPGTRWHPRDGLGLLALVCAMGSIAVAPVLIFLPIHYVGLRRRLRDPKIAPAATLFPLRRAWLACSLLLIVQFGTLVVLAPDALLAFWLPDAGQDPAILPPRDLARTGTAIVLLGLGSALLSARGQLGTLLGRGSWSSGRTVGMAIIGLLVLIPLAWFVKRLGGTLAQASLTDQMIRAVLEQHGPLALIGGAAILAPFSEEILFRGVILAGIARHLAFGWANLIQAALFALSHEELTLMPFYLAFGLLTGWLTLRSGSLRSAVLLHCTNNALVCLALIRLSARATSP